MRQLDNINQIAYLEKVLEELTSYEVDVSLYQKKLESIILDYESRKAKEIEAANGEKIILEYNGDSVLDLGMQLASLKNELDSYIVFLDLMHITSDWNMYIEVDTVFQRVSTEMFRRCHSLLDLFFKTGTQKKILQRYHDLLFKKIWQDYLKGNYYYLEKYDVLKEQIYLQNSIQSFLNDKGIILESDIVYYSLREILEIIFKQFNLESQNIEVIEEVEEVDEESLVLEKKGESFLVSVLHRFHLSSERFFKSNEKKVMAKNSCETLVTASVNSLDDDQNKRLKQEYPDVDFSWLGDIAWQIVELIGIDRVRQKSFDGCNFEGLDLSYVDFADVYMWGANLKNTGACIDPQKVLQKFLFNTNLEGLNLSGADFTDVDIRYANLKNTGARIDPQKVQDKSLCGTNLEGLDLSEADFTDVDICGAKLKNTGAIIDLSKIKECSGNIKEFMDTELEGCYVILRNEEKLLNELNVYQSYTLNLDKAILVHSFEDIEEINEERAIEQDSCEMLSTSSGNSFDIDQNRSLKQDYPDVDFSWLGDVAWDIVRICGIDSVRDKSFKSADLEGLDLSSVDFTNVDIRYANLNHTKAHIDPQKIWVKSLVGTKLVGLDLSNADFTGVAINGANLKNSGARIDPQKVRDKSLFHTNLEGLDLSGADFTDVDMWDANLKNTGACIDPQKVRNRCLYGTNLEGLDLGKADFTNVDIRNANLKNTDVRINFSKIMTYGLSAKDFRDIKLDGCYVLLESIEKLVDRFGEEVRYYLNLDKAILIHSFEDIEENRGVSKVKRR